MTVPHATYETDFHTGSVRAAFNGGTVVFFAGYYAKHPKTGKPWQAEKRVTVNADVQPERFTEKIAYSTSADAFVALVAKLDELAKAKARRA